jgi:hypothetical protein
MTAIGESCRRRGHHLPAVYDPKRLFRGTHWTCEVVPDFDDPLNVRSIAVFFRVTMFFGDGEAT